MTIYNARALTGGAATALDGIDGALLADGDRAIVTTSTGEYHFILDADSAVAELSPFYIAPDSNGGDKRWVRVVTTGKEIVLSATTVSFNSIAATTLFTVPTGYRCVLTKAIVVAGADASTTALTIGQAAALTDFLAAQTLSNLDAQYDAVILQPVPNATPVKGKSYAAGTVLRADVTTNVGGATNTIYLYGILY